MPIYTKCLLSDILSLPGISVCFGLWSTGGGLVITHPFINHIPPEKHTPLKSGEWLLVFKYLQQPILALLIINTESLYFSCILFAPSGAFVSVSPDLNVPVSANHIGIPVHLVWKHNLQNGSSKYQINRGSPAISQIHARNHIMDNCVQVFSRLYIFPGLSPSHSVWMKHLVKPERDGWAQGWCFPGVLS